MDVICPCNLCSELLEFDASVAGSTIACPHCGMDTVLFVPSVPIEHPPKEEGSPLAEDEVVTPQPTPTRHGIIVTTGGEITGRVIENYLGIVRGIVVRSPTGTQDFFGGLKQIIGGNIESYAQVCEVARKDAFDRMVAHAREMNADAIIAMRYDATEFAPGVQEVLAYGTAVKLAVDLQSSG